ncbi:hypothetical protein KSF_106570 [Reticulibacter mediterranei]|uniref:Uncharacterized protein n=1 Tax=Reticulibacter mediterranei TaxID=2778369 RepID=A0A8J3IZ51_9CHLR|nr:hypothetical protein [Reticulibacter mediterranei]GHP00610.1 hypothetical protein KSF_106570 [Reticulibacter mediterranei]
MRIRPYKGFEDKYMIRGMRWKRRRGIAVLKEARRRLNRQVRRRSKKALSLCHQTGGEYDQNAFLVGGEWFY